MLITVESSSGNKGGDDGRDDGGAGVGDEACSVRGIGVVEDRSDPEALLLRSGDSFQRAVDLVTFLTLPSERSRWCV